MSRAASSMALWQADPGPRPDAAEKPPGGHARLGVIMLAHENLPLAARMARIWTESGVRVALHVDSRTPGRAVAAMAEALAGTGTLHAPRRPCAWGTFGIVAATLDAARMLLDAEPQLTHVMLLSGACLPLRPPTELQDFLSRQPDADFIESVNVRDVGWTVGGLDIERFTLHFPFSFRTQRKLFDRFVKLQRRLGVRRRLPDEVVPHIGSQWWCLTRRTLTAILDDPRRAEFDRFFRHVWIPDESYFQTLARRHAIQIESRSLTLAKFDWQGKPYVFYDDHVGLLANSHVFVARKVWPGASELYDAFPRPTRPNALHDEPDTELIEALLDRAALRRRLGRPGLYMQSRFPRKDAENGKTARPYAVFYGLGDLFTGFPDWVAQATGIEMHGHVFGRYEVDFAGKATIGPGALSASTGLRDMDPQGFLTSLIRSCTAMPGMLYSPRDKQKLNWFMVTDPNARLVVVTGAWLVPLLQSDMPFDDIRRIAAKLQRAEVRFLAILDSVWVKAQVQRLALTDLLVHPHETLAELARAVTGTDLRDPLPPAPALRELSGLASLIHALRNAGLQPRNIGDPRLLRALTTAGVDSVIRRRAAS